VDPVNGNSVTQIYLIVSPQLYEQKGHMIPLLDRDATQSNTLWLWHWRTPVIVLKWCVGLSRCLPMIHLCVQQSTNMEHYWQQCAQ